MLLVFVDIQPCKSFYQLSIIMVGGFNSLYRDRHLDWCIFLLLYATLVNKVVTIMHGVR